MFRTRTMMALEGGDAGGGGAGDSGGGGDAGGSAAKLAAELAAAKARIAELDAEAAARSSSAAEAAAEKAAADEAARVAALTTDQKRDEELAALRGEVESSKAAALAQRRAIALERAGVIDKFRSYAPIADPADIAGAKAIDEWVKANPELCRPVSGEPSSALSAIRKSGGNALQQILAGTRKSTLVTASNLGKLK
jgi:hypothetical protein